MKKHYEKSPNIATQGIALKAFQIQRVHFSLPGFPLKLILKVSWIGLVNPESKLCFCVEWNTVGTLSIQFIWTPDF